MNSIQNIKYKNIKYKNKYLKSMLILNKNVVEFFISLTIFI